MNFCHVAVREICVDSGSTCFNSMTLQSMKLG